MYSSLKNIWDKATYPMVLGGWLLIPFFGAMTNVAHAENPDADTLDNLDAFYGAVTSDIPGSITGFGTFVGDAVTDTTLLGSNILSSLGVGGATTTGLSAAFSFATGAAVVGLMFYAAFKVTDAIFSAKPSPA